MKSQKARALLLIAMVIIIYACAPLLLPSGNVTVPTLAPGELEMIIAQTAAAAASQTAVLITPSQTPTPTSSPTVTPSLTPSPTPTFRFILLTLTLPPGIHPIGTGTGTVDVSALNKGFSCKIISVDPVLNANVSAGKPFNAHWVVQNDGTELWNSANMDYRFSGGVKMYVGAKTRDFSTSIASGETLDIIIGMQAPASPGKYSTIWKLHQGQEDFCPMTIKINVSNK
jgi:Ig-like domain from next to BRCA1 gene